MIRLLALLLTAGLAAAPDGGGTDEAAPPELPLDQLFANRLDPDALDEAIDELQAQTVADPKAYRPRILLARGEAFWSELHPEVGADELEAHLRAGVRAAGQALAAVSPHYAAALDKGRTLLGVLPQIEPKGAEALYWIADDQQRLAATHGLATLLLEAPDLRRLFKRVVELAPATYYGGAYLHLAELDLALPTGFGAGLVPVTSELLAALRLGPAQLETHLVWAERWAVKAQDYRVFQSEIAAIQKGSLDAAPEIRAENELVKRKAQKLLQAVPDLFTRAAIGQR